MYSTYLTSASSPDMPSLAHNVSPLVAFENTLCSVLRRDVNVSLRIGTWPCLYITQRSEAFRTYRYFLRI